MDDQGCKTSLSSGFLTIHDKAGRLLTKTKKTSGNMSKMKIDINERCNLIKEEASEAWLWHKRFCYQSFYTLQEMIRGDLVKGLPQFQNPNEVCAHCIPGKRSRASFLSSSYRASSVLELIHMDICGPMSSQTVGGKRYFCWDLRLEKLSKSLSKIMIAAEGVESKHSTSWKHQE